MEMKKKILQFLVCKRMVISSVGQAMNDWTKPAIEPAYNLFKEKKKLFQNYRR